MTLTIQQAAAQLGMTVRQVRYMIQQQKLRARKVEGRWVIDSSLVGATGGLPASAFLGRRASDPSDANAVLGATGGLSASAFLGRRASNPVECRIPSVSTTVDREIHL